MAEGLAHKLRDQDALFYSRGLSVSYESGPNDNAVRAMKAYEVDINNHISKQFDANEVDESTLVLTMTRRHKEAIKAYYPRIGKQVYTLTEYVGLDGDVKDPFGQSQAVYDACAKQLKDLIDKMTI